MAEKQNIQSLELQGLDGRLITIESNYRKGFNQFRLIGLVNKSISEAKERVTIALSKLKFGYPYGSYIVNLLPASISKSGSHYDLAIALSVLLQTKNKIYISKNDLSKTIFIGELALNGEIRIPDNLWALIRAAKELNIKTIITGKIKRSYIDLTQIGIDILQFENLESVINHLESDRFFQTPAGEYKKPIGHNLDSNVRSYLKILLRNPKLAEILAIAAVGRHNLLLDGPPGVGKTTFLEKFNYLLPDYNSSQLLDILAINSLTNGLDEFDRNFSIRPRLIKPSYTVSSAALIGGGNPIRPGIISKCTNGVLFLDEISEFKQSTLELLRDPLETKKVSIERVKQIAIFPADLQMLIARNPCPCGFYETEQTERCKCNVIQINKYRSKISGAILDRIDIKYKLELTSWVENSNNNTISENEIYAYWNRLNSAHSQNQKIKMSKTALKISDSLLNDYKFSHRSIKKIRNVARSIAKLDNTNIVDEKIFYKAIKLN